MQFRLSALAVCALVCQQFTYVLEGGNIMLEQLVRDSERHMTAMESAALRNLQLSSPEARKFATYAEANPNDAAYHVLIGLRRADGAEYQQVPSQVKAAILCSALASQIHLNDWGYLDPKESRDGEAAQALVELGATAKPSLVGLLNDCRPAPLFGSEEATMSSMYKYRRCDFAYRYLAQIFGSTPVFDPDPAQRDNEIAVLKRRVLQE
jgi:hypothetical protein